AVCADQTNFFRGIDLEPDVSKHVLCTERLRDAIELYDQITTYAAFLVAEILLGSFRISMALFSWRSSSLTTGSFGGGTSSASSFRSKASSTCCLISTVGLIPES